MAKRVLVIIPVLAVLICGIWGVRGEAPAEEKAKGEPEFKYGGLKPCMLCHKSKKIGEQYQIWLKGPHGGAYETLASEESDAIAKKLGFKTPAQETPDCLKCHATAYGVKPEEAVKMEEVKLEDAVQCESCHGPGSNYKSMKAMKDHQLALEAGLWEITEEVCTRCHNKESPTYKPFDFKKALIKVQHPVPKAEEKSAEGGK